MGRGWQEATLEFRQHTVWWVRSQFSFSLRFLCSPQYLYFSQHSTMSFWSLFYLPPQIEPNLGNNQPWVIYPTQMQGEHLSRSRGSGMYHPYSQIYFLMCIDLSLSTSSTYRWDLNSYTTLTNCNLPCSISPSSYSLISFLY